MPRVSFEVSEEELALMHAHPRVDWEAVFQRALRQQGTLEDVVQALRPEGCLTQGVEGPAPGDPGIARSRERTSPVRQMGPDSGPLPTKVDLAADGRIATTKSARM